ncbi:MAG: tail fiber domain-containing protein, partial [Bacteroidota bacterium]
EILNTGSSVFIGEGSGANDDFSNNKNVFIGYEVGYSNTTGFFNLFQGYRAGYSNETGEANIFLGYQTGYENISGSSNLFVGYNAGYDNTSGRENVFLGYTSGRSNTTGRNNVFLGNSSGYENTTGTNNVSLGYLSGYENTIGSGNISIGTFAGYQNKTGINNVFIGYEAGYYETDSSKLYIENSNSTTPLIYGDFEADSLQINGKLNINGAFNFPTTDGLANQVLTTDGNGTLDWATSNGAFNSENGLTYSINKEDDFLFGADSINYGAGTEYKLLFNQAKGAFRAGMVTGSSWNEDKQGDHSFAAGQNTEATASNSAAFGRSTDATGENSIAFGRNTDAENENTASFGYYTEAQNTNATAFGYYTDAEGENSTSFGYYTIASGLNSAAFGSNTLAEGENATTFGYEVYAPSYAEFAIGYNSTTYDANNTTGANDEDKLFVIGNGASTTSRSDALVVYKSGDMQLNGQLTTEDSIQINLGGTRRFVVRENENGNTVIDLPNNNENTFLGAGAGDENTTGAQNTYFGYQAGLLTDEGVHNTFSGYKAGRGNTSGNYNSFYGSGAGSLSLSTNNNVYLGYEAGAASVAGSSNVFIGYQAGKDENNSNKLYIENSSSSSPLIYGEFNNDRVVINGNSSNNSNNRTLFVNGSIGATSAFNNDSDRRLKTDIQTIPNALRKVLQMRGVTYQWKDGRETGDRLGFIAQEVESILPQVVDYKNDHYTMQYAPITAVLVEAVKEQQSQIKALQSENEALKAQVAKINQLEVMLEQLQAQIEN